MNYLDKIPERNSNFKWSENDEGIVNLEVQNRGVFHFIAQKLLKKPPITFVHLDEFGSFVWNNTNGSMSVYEIGKKVQEKFGENANPLYERLVKFFNILESYSFITWK